MKIYLVGGAVRDRLLSRQVSERDWVVIGATPEQMLALNYRQVGKDFPVFLHPETSEEYALARAERKIGPGYTGFAVDATPQVSLEEDLRRRDLTINAMAEDEAGNITDPYGGMQDLNARILRHVSEAFVEDPLRVLRVARFAARYATLGFCVAEQTMDLMRQISAGGELATIAPERIWVETQKTLQEETPSVYFEVLRQCGALQQLFPELAALWGVPQRKDYHPEVDTGIHTMLVVDAAAKISSDVGVRLAALLHDLGKAKTPAEILPSHHGHEVAGVPLIRKLCDRVRVPTQMKELAMLVGEYHTHAHRALELKPVTAWKLLEKLDVMRRPERVEQFLMACLADCRGRPGYENEQYLQADYLRELANACRSVSTTEFLTQGLTGKAVGAALLQRRLERIAEIKHDFTPNNKPFDNS
ncbi:MAG: multifunctional CCA addition/repair protein [Gammaproteobacteria bacterium]|nr:multifunctional CCA addition/repair protein [Gammaproteobacteria bacterium]